MVGLLPCSVCTERLLETTVSGEPHNKESTYSPVPLLEGASFEENEDLHSMWAALLAYAASPTSGDVVRPGFIATLRQFSTDEALMLNRTYDHAQVTGERDFSFAVSLTWLAGAYAELGFGEVERKPDGIFASTSVDPWRFDTCLDSLEAVQLIRRRHDLANVEWSAIYKIEINEPHYSLTHRGHQFVVACRPPKPKAEADQTEISKIWCRHRAKRALASALPRASGPLRIFHTAQSSGMSRQEIDGSRRRTPLTMVLLKSASARNRTFTTGELCAVHPERASASREDRREAVPRCGFLPPTSRFGELDRRPCQPGLPAISAAYAMMASRLAFRA